jgi:hypothetical protein
MFTGCLLESIIQTIFLLIKIEKKHFGLQHLHGLQIKFLLNQQI